MCLIIIKKLINNIITMNDSMSILLATTILALGGLGLYVYRTNHDDQDGGDKSDTRQDDSDNEESIFGSSNLFNWGSSEDKQKEDKQKDKEKEQDVILDEELEENEVKPRKRNNVKTQRNRKASAASRRRY
jgi:hypothetical protein